MPEKSAYEVGSPAEASKAMIAFGAEIAEIYTYNVAQVLFDVAVAHLPGIQIWGMGRKPYAVQPAIPGVSQVLCAMSSPPPPRWALLESTEARM